MDRINKIASGVEHRLGRIKTYDQGGVVGEDENDVGISAGRAASAQGDKVIQGLLDSPDEVTAPVNQGTAAPMDFSGMAKLGTAIGGMKAQNNYKNLMDTSAGDVQTNATDTLAQPGALGDQGGLVTKRGISPMIKTMGRIQSPTPGPRVMSPMLYDDGGTVQPTPEEALADGQHVPAVLKVGERVLTPEQSKAYDKVREPDNAGHMDMGPAPQIPEETAPQIQTQKGTDAERKAISVDKQRSMGQGQSGLVGLGIAKIHEHHLEDQPAAAPSMGSIPNLSNVAPPVPDSSALPNMGQRQAPVPTLGEQPVTMRSMNPNMQIPGLTPSGTAAAAPPQIQTGYRAQAAELSKAQKEAMHAYGLSGDPEDKAKADAASLALQNLKFQNPWGTAENHPGFLGKMAHIGAAVGNIAGNIVAPETMALIPGTAANRQSQARYTMGQIEKETPEVTSRMSLEDKEAKAVPLEQQYTTAAGELRAAKPGSPEAAAAQAKMDDIHAGLMSGKEPAKEAVPENRLADANMAVQAAQVANDPVALKKAQNDVKAITDAINSKTGATEKPFDQPTVDSTNKALARRYQVLHPGQTLPPEYTLPNGSAPADFARIDKTMEQEEKALGTKTQQQTNELDKEKAATAKLTAAKLTASRKDIAAHDKNYVMPAEANEKSYDMMDHAYKEYKAAEAQGKELPTGAQSMVALSTHLATTFGQVKGSRITKDMIQEHLGARSIPDSAIVAVNKLINGDKLSPAQWEAFHNLIRTSRDLSWDTAVREADRKHVPIDFLPDGQTAMKVGKHYGIIPTEDVAKFQKTNPDAENISQ